MPETETIDTLKDLYTFNQPARVTDFLITRDDLVKILVESYRQIKKIFSNQFLDILLEYSSDPEEEFDGLLAVVRTKLSPSESLELLDKFDDEWFLDSVDYESRSIFSVTVRPG